MENELLNLGFSKNEAQVYLALLELGSTGAGGVIKKTGLHRNIVYETLDKLIAKKMVMKFQQKNIALFKVMDPGRILTAQKEKLALAEQLVPALTKLAKTKQDIAIYEGAEGLRTFSLLNMEKMTLGETLYVLGTTKEIWFELMAPIYRRYERLRLKKKIKLKMLVYGASPKDEALAKNPRNLTEIVTLPESLDAPANTLIYEDCVALQIMTEPYSVIEIKNKALAQAYLNYFNLLWLQGKK